MCAEQHFGAEEACWAHNPKVVGSRPTSAILICRPAMSLFSLLVHTYIVLSDDACGLTCIQITTAAIHVPIYSLIEKSLRGRVPLHTIERADTTLVSVVLYTVEAFVQ